MSFQSASRSASGLRTSSRFFKAGLLAIAAISGFALMGISNEAAAAKFKKIETGQPNTTTVLMNGPINPGDLVKFQKALADVPQNNKIVVMLRSPGGAMSEGLAIGRFVHARMITTVVPQGFGCHSACTAIFLAGRDSETGQPARIMMSGAKIGFHQARYYGLADTITRDKADELQTEIQDSVARLNNYYRDLGIDPEFMELSLSAAHNDIALLSELQALRLGIYVMDTHTGKLMTPAAFKVQATLQ